jgi:hypothetical protein
MWRSENIKGGPMTTERKQPTTGHVVSPGVRGDHESAPAKRASAGSGPASPSLAEQPEKAFVFGGDTRGAVAERSFPCALCEAQAGAVSLFGPADAALLCRDSFLGRMESRISARAFAAARRAIASGNIKALHRVDRETASFYCPDCHACYCGNHWDWWSVFEDDGWHDSERGRCPRGHERLLQD